MGYEREHASGTPSWADLATPDMVVSSRFYGGLFGWDSAARGSSGLAHGYLTFQVDRQDVAGLGPLMDDDAPAWTVHIAVSDADAVAATVVGHGGTTLVAPHDVFDAGRTALFADPTGAVFGVWQPASHRGAELIGVDGAMCWAQLASRNIEASKRFYGAVFGWVGFTTPYETSTYTRFRLDGREVAGMVEMDRSWPRELPSHWMPYFAVEDCDVVAAKVDQLGGEVAVEPYDLPDMGRAAVLGDPHGAVFSVMARQPGFVGLTPPERATTQPALDGLDQLAERPNAPRS